MGLGDIGGSIGETLGLTAPRDSGAQAGNNAARTNGAQTVNASLDNGAANDLNTSAPAMLSVGDRFVFDNPEITWQVVGRSGNAIYWQADNGDTQITDANPILPALEWRSQRRGSGKRVISGLTGNIFPLEVGKTVRFASAVTTDQAPYNWQFNWACTTTQRHMVTTPLLGEVDAFEIICSRQSQDEIVFDYAPEVGHYVRMEARGMDGYGRTVRNLIAYSRAGSSMNLGETSQAAGLGPGIMNQGMNQAMPLNQSMNQGMNMQGFGAQSPNGLLPSESLGASPSLAPIANLGGGNVISSAPSNQQGLGAAGAGLNNVGSNDVAGNDSPVAPGFDMGLVPEANNSRRQSLFETPPALIGSGQNAGTGEAMSAAPQASAPVARQAAPQPQASTAAFQTSNSASGINVHLASYRQVETAERGWRELSTQYGDILSGLSPVIVAADVAGKGTFQRLLAGSISSDADARDICRRLQARGAYCAVVR